MTTLTPVHDHSRSDAGRRAQGAVAIAGLVAAVAVTVALVATPVSSRPTSAASTDEGRLLPAGVRVDVQGGEPFVAYSTADRLSHAGASVGAVLPAGAEGARADVAGRETVIVYYDRRQQATAERIRDMLGRGTLRREQAFRPVVDVTIVLGKDLSRL